ERSPKRAWSSPAPTSHAQRAPTWKRRWTDCSTGYAPRRASPGSVARSHHHAHPRGLAEVDVRVVLLVAPALEVEHPHRLPPERERPGVPGAAMQDDAHEGVEQERAHALDLRRVREVDERRSDRDPRTALERHQSLG